MNKKLNAVTLILSDARGTYIPRDFICDQNNEIAVSHCAAWGLNETNKEWWEDAANPDSEGYWEAWAWIMNHAEFKDEDGYTYRLLQEGDLWGVCYDRMTPEERRNFGMED